MSSKYFTASPLYVFNGEVALAEDVNAISNAIEAGFDIVLQDFASISTELNNAINYAEEWANKAEDSLISVEAGGDGVDDYSALHHAAKSADSATAAAASESAASTSETNAAASETLASQWASLTTGIVDTTDYSAKAYAIGGTGVTGAAGAAKEWATTLAGTVDGSDYSAKEYAIGTTVAAGSAKDWAREAEDVLVDATEYSAKHYSAKSSASATASASSASDAALSASAASTSETNAAASETLASQWASLTTGLVDTTDYSSKAYAIGGTGIDGVIGSAKKWATEAEDVLVSTTEYSAKHYAAKAAASAASISNDHDSLSAVMFPKDWETVNKQGWVHGGFNQQWGGGLWGGRLPDGTEGEVVTGSIKSSYTAQWNFGNATATQGASQGFKIPNAFSIGKALIRVGKVGNPVDNVTLEIHTDSAGKPSGTPVTNGTATPISGKAISSGVDLLFEFPTPPSLSADVQYHLVVSRSGAVDASNYYYIIYDNDAGYPLGDPYYDNAGVWTAQPSAYAIYFKIIPTAATATIRDGKFHCYDTDQLGQIGYLTQPLKNFWSGDEFAGQFKVDAVPTASRPLAQAYYDNDNHMTFETDASSHAILRCNGSTITGTSVIALGDSLGWYYDGTSLHLTVNGVEEGTAIAVSFSDDFDQGTFILGGGIPTDLTWTKETDMSLLPSADGWTYNGTATEANVFSVSGGKLYQNAAGAGSASARYYKTATFNNATGWRVDTKLQVKSTSNTSGVSECTLEVADGTKNIYLLFHEYFIDVYDVASLGFIQVDMTSRPVEVTLLGKGSDFYVLLDGKLAFDGTGLLTNTTAVNQVQFGDYVIATPENADAIWHYVNYIESYERPQATDTPIYDFGFWQKDASSLLPDVAASTVKSVCGLKRDWIEEVERNQHVTGITSNATTTSTTFVQIPELFQFILGSSVSYDFSDVTYLTTASASAEREVAVDGVSHRKTVHRQGNETVGRWQDAGISGWKRLPHGLHYINANYKTTAGTIYQYSTYRSLTSKSK